MCICQEHRTWVCHYCLYVDDILIMGSNNEVIKTTKEMFKNKFDMKDLGVVDVILGIKISKTSIGLILSQSHYIEKILKKFKQDDSSSMRTPVDVNLHLSKNNGKCLSQQEYAQAIGSLMYVMNCTFPDIAYAVSKLSRYTSNSIMFLILETEFNSVSIFTSNKLIFILYFFRNGISVAKGNSILPANVPAINLRRKIRPFQFSSLIPFLIPYLSSRHLLPPTISDGFLFRFKIL